MGIRWAPGVRKTGWREECYRVEGKLNSEIKKLKGQRDWARRKIKKLETELEKLLES